jgi:hypothetical protein
MNVENAGRNYMTRCPQGFLVTVRVRNDSDTDRRDCFSDLVSMFDRGCGEMEDACVSETHGKPWRFESSQPHEFFFGSVAQQVRASV